LAIERLTAPGDPVAIVTLRAIEDYGECPGRTQEKKRGMIRR
jgi:hypothetical protein